ncbi:hypothetical protein FRC11_014934 [Ceratobasidium sp. 423]|nr:hypothetical protein FRC11_014934 [Ceratobasidium sp. 423]
MTTLFKPASLSRGTTLVGIFRGPACQTSWTRTITSRRIGTGSPPKPQPNSQELQLVHLRIHAPPDGRFGSPSRMSIPPRVDILQSMHIVIARIPANGLQDSLLQASLPTLTEAVAKFALGRPTQLIMNEERMVTRGDETDSRPTHNSSQPEGIDSPHHADGPEGVNNSSQPKYIDCLVLFYSPKPVEARSSSQTEHIDRPEGGFAKIEEVEESSTGEEGTGESDDLRALILDDWSNDPEMAALFADAGIKL